MSGRLGLAAALGNLDSAPVLCAWVEFMRSKFMPLLQLMEKGLESTLDALRCPLPLSAPAQQVLSR